MTWMLRKDVYDLSDHIWNKFCYFCLDMRVSYAWIHCNEKIFGNTYSNYLWFLYGNFLNIVWCEFEMMKFNHRSMCKFTKRFSVLFKTIEFEMHELYTKHIISICLHENSSVLIIVVAFFKCAKHNGKGPVFICSINIHAFFAFIISSKNEMTKVLIIESVVYPIFLMRVIKAIWNYSITI